MTVLRCSFAFSLRGSNNLVPVTQESLEPSPHHRAGRGDALHDCAPMLFSLQPDLFQVQVLVLPLDLCSRHGLCLYPLGVSLGPHLHLMFQGCLSHGLLLGNTLLLLPQVLLLASLILHELVFVALSCQLVLILSLLLCLLCLHLHHLPPLLTVHSLAVNFHLLDADLILLDLDHLLLLLSGLLLLAEGQGLLGKSGALKLLGSPSSSFKGRGVKAVSLRPVALLLATHSLGARCSRISATLPTTITSKDRNLWGFQRYLVLVQSKQPRHYSALFFPLLIDLKSIGLISVGDK